MLFVKPSAEDFLRPDVGVSGECLLRLTTQLSLMNPGMVWKGKKVATRMIMGAEDFVADVEVVEREVALLMEGPEPS